MSEKLDIEGMPTGQLDRMFDHRTTEEVVADIVAAEPEKHGVSVAERLARAKSAAASDPSIDEDERLIRAAGGDPDELLPGNRPRWTADGTVVTDHATGEKYEAATKQYETIKSGDQGNRGVDKEIVSATDSHVGALVDGEVLLDATCATHDFGEDPQESTPCKACGKTLEEWANE